MAPRPKSILLQPWLIVTGIVVLVLAAFDLLGTRHVDGEYRVRMRGRIMDVETGQPIAGARLMTVPRMKYATRERVEKVRERYGGTPPDEPTWLYRLGTTGPDGSFDLVVLTGWGAREGGLGIRWPVDGFARYAGVRVLFVEAEGYGARFLDCTGGTWIEHEPESIANEVYATNDVGQIRLRKAP